MKGSSRLTSAQVADAIARQRAGRPDIAAMSNQERRDAGLMDRRQAAEHEHLAILPHTRCADRVRGPDPDDIWADNLPIWEAQSAAGHAECGSWWQDAGGRVVCACAEIIPMPQGVTS